jgi:hypothetical protein
MTVNRSVPGSIPGGGVEKNMETVGESTRSKGGKR